MAALIHNSELQWCRGIWRAWLVGRERLRAEERAGAGHLCNFSMFPKINRRDSAGHLQKAEFFCRAGWPDIWNIWICNNTFLLEIINKNYHCIGFSTPSLPRGHLRLFGLQRSRANGQWHPQFRHQTKSRHTFFYGSYHLEICSLQRWRPCQVITGCFFGSKQTSKASSRTYFCSSWSASRIQTLLDTWSSVPSPKHIFVSKGAVFCHMWPVKSSKRCWVFLKFLSSF